MTKKIQVVVFDGDDNIVAESEFNAEEKYTAITGPSGEFILGVPGDSITVIASGQWTEVVQEWYADGNEESSQES